MSNRSEGASGRGPASAAGADAQDFDRLGPFYEVDGDLAGWLGVDLPTLQLMVSRWDLLACPTADGNLVAPTWQLDAGSRALWSGLAEVIRVLGPAALSAWTVASWLTTPSPVFDGRAAIDLVRAGSLGWVMSEARVDACRWAQ